MDRPQCPPPRRQVRAPAFTPPPGSCDCHVHIIGPQALYPLSPDTPVDMPDSTLEQFQAVQEVLGVPRALIVASGGHGFNYQPVLHVLSVAPDRYRGVVLLAPDVTDRELTILSDAGVVGARFYPGVNPPDLRTLGRLHERGWSAHFTIANATQRLAWDDLMTGFAGRYVIEHCGFPDPGAGVEQPHFRKILSHLETDRCWIKLSPRFSQCDVPPFEDTLPYIRALVDRRPDRLLYGSDYPHPNYFKPMPDEADFLDLMLLWTTTEQQRRLIMASNPAALFGFPDPT